MTKRKKKDRMRIIHVSEPSEEDDYLSRIDARMTRLALRLDKKRRRWYVV